MHDDYLVETIPIDDDHRIQVFYDQSPSNPRGDWYMITGALTVNQHRRDRIDVEPVHSFPGDMADAYDRLDYELVARWAAVFYDITVEYHDNTFWWADPDLMAENWPELARGSDEYIAQERLVMTGERETYRQWAEGEVYGVVLQTREGYVKATRLPIDVPITEPDLIQWEDDDSIWGNYLTDDYTALDVAREHFDITIPKELTA